jgi:hypothetical protein
MKQLLLVPLILFSACASQRPNKVTASIQAPVGRPVSSDALRVAERLKEYRLGRYVDGADPLTMHEGHPIYRAESTPRWDLRPTAGAASTTTRVVENAPPVSANDSVVAEVNKQRAATRAFTEQTASLNQKLDELAEAVGKTQEITKQNLAFKRDLSTLRERLDGLEAQLRGRKSTVPPGSSPTLEDKW